LAALATKEDVDQRQLSPGNAAQADTAPTFLGGVADIAEKEPLPEPIAPADEPSFWDRGISVARGIRDLFMGAPDAVPPDPLGDPGTIDTDARQEPKYGAPPGNYPNAGSDLKTGNLFPAAGSMQQLAETYPDLSGTQLRDLFQRQFGKTQKEAMQQGVADRLGSR
jgi:hypothetical protein